MADIDAPNAVLDPRDAPPIQPPAQPAPLTGAASRAPIMPPSSVSGANGGVPMPDLGSVYSQAYSHLPVEQAGQAVTAALKYQGMRGYQQDLQSGMDASRALSKWAPLLFGGSPAGMRAAIPPQMTPYQNAMLQLRQNALAKPPAQMTPYESAEIKLRQDEAAKPKKSATISIPIDPADESGPKITGSMDDPDVQAAKKKYDDFNAPKPAAPSAPGMLSNIANKVKGYFEGSPTPAQPAAPAGGPPTPKSQAEFDALPQGSKFINPKDGKLYIKK